MDPLLTVIITWLAINFGLPATDALPRLEHVSSAEMAEARLTRAAAGSGRPPPTETGDGVFAFYDDTTRTIYLHRQWTGATPADSALLVHEMVHHLQTVAGQSFACPAEREKDAYRAQRAWLEQFGRTLEQEFALDPMTVLVRTSCVH